MSAHPELLVPLSALPGFDADGLLLHHKVVSSPSGAGYCLYDELGDMGETASCCVADPSTYQSQWMRRTALLLDLTDASTRDRVMRWIATRGGCIDCHNGLWWMEMVNDLGWTLAAPNAQMYRWTRRPMEGHHREDRRWHLPALEPLNTLEDTRLPDGSRRVDAHALALVAVHIGSQP